MLIGTDGACKWGGTPECVSCGVAFIQTDEAVLYKSRVEDSSTSQRGELNGLICALEYAAENIKPQSNESVIIITDSEYLHNAVMKEWYDKWQQNDWIGSTGQRVKNVDKWVEIANLIDTLRNIGSEVYVQWTKGHLISGLTPAVVKRIVNSDPTGIMLYSQIQAIANRPSEHDRIVSDFNKHRTAQGVDALPDDVAIDWVTMNVTADLLAGYIKDTVLTAGKL